MDQIFRLGIKNISKLQQLEKKDRDKILKELITIMEG